MCTTNLSSPKESPKNHYALSPTCTCQPSISHINILNIFNIQKHHISSPLVSFGFICKSSCLFLSCLSSNLILIVINILQGRKITYISMLINTLSLYGYRVPKFGMIFLSHYAIFSIFQTIKANSEITSSRCKLSYNFSFNH